MPQATALIFQLWCGNMRRRYTDRYFHFRPVRSSSFRLTLIRIIGSLFLLWLSTMVMLWTYLGSTSVRLPDIPKTEQQKGDEVEGKTSRYYPKGSYYKDRTSDEFNYWARESQQQPKLESSLGRKGFYDYTDKELEEKLARLDKQYYGLPIVEISGINYTRYIPTQANASDEYLVFSSNDPVFNRALPDRFKARKKALQDVCAANPHLNLAKKEPGVELHFMQNFQFDFIIVHEQLKIMWCMTPKSGSTLWRKILIAKQLGGLNDPSDLTNMPTIFAKTAKMLSWYPIQTALRMLKTYPKFMFTRHPFDRLHSSYTDKILGSNNFVVNSIHEEIKDQLNKRKRHVIGNREVAQNYSNFTERSDLLAAPKWLKDALFAANQTNKDIRQRPISLPWPNTKLESFDSANDPGEDIFDEPDESLEDERPITMSEFLTYITQHETFFPGTSMNEHWQPMYNICKPCVISYDFIGQLENMDEEGRVLFDLLGYNQTMVFPGGQPNHSFKKANMTKPIFSHLDRALYDKLRNDIYGLDFAMFNYTDQGYTPASVSSQAHHETSKKMVLSAETLHELNISRRGSSRNNAVASNRDIITDRTGDALEESDENIDDLVSREKEMEILMSEAVLKNEADEEAENEPEAIDDVNITHHEHWSEKNTISQYLNDQDRKMLNPLTYHFASSSKNNNNNNQTPIGVRYIKNLIADKNTSINYNNINKNNKTGAYITNIDKLHLPFNKSSNNYTLSFLSFEKVNKNDSQALKTHETQEMINVAKKATGLRNSNSYKNFLYEYDLEDS